MRLTTKATAKSIDSLLPQLQCGQCGHGGCAPYANAIADQGEGIDRCAPGGGELLASLALLTSKVQPLEVNAECLPAPSGGIAFIDEAWCIGCTKCLVVCPVDAIVGANKMMHTVLAKACTGCDLCVPVCPVDCIDIRPRSAPLDDTEREQSRVRAQARRQRLDTKASVRGNKPEDALVDEFRRPASEAEKAVVPHMESAKKNALLSGILAKITK